VFTPDDEYDRTYASDGTSRYGAYLAQYAALFNDADQLTTDAGRFAGAALKIALPPVMGPGYVRTHGRVLHTQVSWDEDERQAVCVDLAVSSPPEAAELVRPWRRWTRDGHGRWSEPDDYAYPVALTVLRIAVPLTGIPLPDPGYRAGLPDTRTAKLAVRAICVTVNAALQSVVAFDPLAGSPQ
jgi:hypothetical protein